MLTTAALLLTLSGAAPTRPAAVPVVTIEDVSQAQLDRQQAVARARADHVRRLEHAADLTKLQAEALAAARAREAGSRSLASEPKPTVASPAVAAAKPVTQPPSAWSDREAVGPAGVEVAVRDVRFGTPTTLQRSAKAR